MRDTGESDVAVSFGMLFVGLMAHLTGGCVWLTMWLIYKIVARFAA